MKQFSQITKEEEERAHEIHKGAIVVDGLACPVQSRWQFDRMIQGGVTAANWTIVDLGHDIRDAIREITMWYSRFKSMSGRISHVTTVQDIREAKKQDKLGVIFGLQDPRPIEDDLGILEVLYKLGVRIFQLTYNERGLIGDGTDERTDGGLSKFGIGVIAEMNRLGILIDLSHCGRKTALEAVDASRGIVAFTHANSEVLCKNPRNKSDEELKAVAEKGGVIGTVAWGPMIWSKEKQQPKIDDYLNQIDYMVKLVGIDHVGIGLDISEGVYRGSEKGKEMSIAYDAKYPEIVPSWLEGDPSPGENYAKDLSSYVMVPNITKGLVCRGYSEQEIKKILGENFLRVFSKVW